MIENFAKVTTISVPEVPILETLPLQVFNVKLAREAGLKLVVCADTAETAKKIAEKVTSLNLNEISLAVEWDEYIGTKISMVENKPEEIEKVMDNFIKHGFS